MIFGMLNCLYLWCVMFTVKPGFIWISLAQVMTIYRTTDATKLKIVTIFKGKKNTLGILNWKIFGFHIFNLKKDWNKFQSYTSSRKDWQTLATKIGVHPEFISLAFWRKCKFSAILSHSLWQNAASILQSNYLCQHCLQKACRN